MPKCPTCKRPMTDSLAERLARAADNQAARDRKRVAAKRERERIAKKVAATHERLAQPDAMRRGES